MVILPLNPVDLTEIYKSKLDNDEFTLAVDYTSSKEKMNARQVLIYLSNTAFKCGFDSVDAKLVEAYMTLNFMVDSPSLDRIVANILKVRMGVEPTDSLELFGLDNISSFIANNEQLVEDLVVTIATLPLFVADSVNAMEDGNIKITGLPSYTEYSSSRLGLNFINIVSNGFDAALKVISAMGFNDSMNTSIFNDESKYAGVDLMKMLHVRGVSYTILDMFPEDMIQAKVTG